MNEEKQSLEKTKALRATEHTECAGCQWREGAAAGQWCGMLKDEPARLPCAQHDMFEAARQATTRIMRKRPELMRAFFASIALATEKEKEAPDCSPEVSQKMHEALSRLRATMPSAPEGDPGDNAAAEHARLVDEALGAYRRETGGAK